MKREAAILCAKAGPAERPNAGRSDRESKFARASPGFPDTKLPRRGGERVAAPAAARENAAMATSVTAAASWKRLSAPLRAIVARVIEGESRRAGDIGVRLTGDDELRGLNRRWRGMDRATDVISFAYDEHEPDAATRPVSGDLAVSLDRVRAQARRFRVTPGAELARLVVHGTLHLCGHDHVRAAERRTMRAREERALRAVGVQVRELDRRWRAASRGA